MLSYYLGHSHLKNLVRHKVEKHQNEKESEEKKKDKPGNSVAIYVTRDLMTIFWSRYTIRTFNR